METTGIGLGDAMVLAKQNGFGADGAGYMWNNPFFYLIFLALFGNGGFGFGGNNANAQNLQNAIYASNDQQTLMSQIRGIANGIASGFSDSTYALNNAINGVAQGVNNGVNTIVNGITEARFSGVQNTNNIQMGICNLSHNIDNLKFVNEQNTCKITTAIHEEGEATRALINANTLQGVRDELANTKLALSQQEQNAYLISQLKTTA